MSLDGAPERAEQGRLIALGDVHGHARLLKRLLSIIEPNSDDQLVFLGDYIDRGPDSYGVIEELLALKRRLPKTVFLRGNHDQWMLNWLFGDDDTFVYLGGRQTRESYARIAGVAFDDFNDEPASLLAVLPPEHLRFIDETRLYFEVEDTLFVHGGIDPAVPGMERQSVYDLLMGHRDFFKHPRFPKPIVVGHTSTQIFRHETPIFLSNGIVMCDTSCHRTGRLSAVAVRSGEVYQARLEELDAAG